MSRITEVTTSRLKDLLNRIDERIRDCAFLEHAAQACTDLLYDEFEESLVLGRVFATIPFGDLPEPNQQFVIDMAMSANILSLINTRTPVLSLLATRGREDAWNERRLSREHVGIPLASGDFVESIPMISRLLKELGLRVHWIDQEDTEIVTGTAGMLNGVFYVPDAKTAVDQRGRRIITAQDFVSNYGVKTVFGIGGGYLASPVYITSIVFMCETIEKRHVERFLPVINALKARTV